MNRCGHSFLYGRRKRVLIVRWAAWIFMMTIIIASTSPLLIRSARADVGTEGSVSELHAGRVEEVQYTVSDGSGLMKSVFVYLPYGYEKSPLKYDIVYLLHGSSGSGKSYFDTRCVTDFQKRIDWMIGQGILNPVMIAVPTYYSDCDSQMKLPLCEKSKTHCIISPGTDRRYHPGRGKPIQEFCRIYG